MRQTKKLTRRQREFLLKKKIDITGVRVLTDTKECIVYVTPDGEKHKVDK